MNRRLLLFVLFLLGHYAIAQPLVKIEHYSGEDGLSHDIITSMYKDREGYMWFGTWNGINRFDGKNFTSFTSAPGDRSQLKNDRVDRIFEDHANHLWIKSYDGQVYRFDKGSERFSSLSSLLKLKNKFLFDRILSLADGMLWVNTAGNGLLAVDNVKSENPTYQLFSTANLPSNQINFLFRQSNSSYWVGTKNGLVKLSKNKKGAFVAKLIKFDGLASADFSAVMASEANLYFGTAKGDLIILNANSGRHQQLSVSKGKINSLLLGRRTGHIYITTSLGELITYEHQTATSTTAIYPVANALFSMFEDKSGNLWVEPQKRGVVRYDVSRSTFQTFVQRNDAINNIPNNHFKVFEDNKGVVWSILRDGGFGYYNEHTGKFNYFYNEPGSDRRRLSNLVSIAFYDPSGVMWLHTDQRGLDKIIFHPNNFKQDLVVEPGIFKTQNEIRGLLNDAKNRIWVGAKSGLLYIFENGKKANVTIENLPSGGLGMIYSIYQTKNGTIWLGTKENGVFRIDPIDLKHTRYRLVHYMHKPNDDHSLSSNQVYSITEDNWGRIWVGTFDRGLNMLDPKRDPNVFSRFYDQKNNYPSQFHKIRHLTIDGKGRLWIASTDGLVIGEALNGGRMSFKTYSKQPGNIQSLGNNDIQYIFRDHLNRMWLATSGGGLNLAIEKPSSNSFVFKIYATKNGLANNYILSCVEDKQHRLWLATKSSLTRFDPQLEKFDNFNSYDGVPNDGFSESSCQITKDGRLVFGTIRGLLSFDPEQIRYYPIRSNIAFTGLQINNEDVPLGVNGGVLQKNINNTSEIKLAYNQNTISVDYTVLDFRSVNRQHYLYRLKGFDTTWHDNKNQRRATYTNLPPGKYKFEVKSPDLDNYVVIPSKKLNITILPPPWKTWWAYIIYFLLFCTITETIRRIIFTVLRLRQRIAVEHKMTELKMAFFTNVSHELRTPLTLILNPIDELLRKEQLSHQGKEYASIVQRNAKRMVLFVNQLLDLRKSQSGQSKLKLSKIELKSFIEDVASNFKEEAKLKRIQLLVTANQQLWVPIDTDKMETVIYNLLSNSFKFSDSGKKIEIILSNTVSTFKIEVNDEGCGVNSDDLENIFQLYHESEHPNTQQLKGTGIGLALAREHVELHGGNIYATNREGQGLSVALVLPLQPIDSLQLVENETENKVEQQTEVVPIAETIVKEDLSQQLVLLVEDNDDMRSFLSAHLSHKYRIKTAGDGLQGLSMAKKFQPDLILSDIMMPKMDGIMMLDKLKQDQETSHIPVILLSAKRAIESQIMGLKYGADYYISKPFDNELLFAALANILEQRRIVIDRLLSKQKIVELGPSQIVVTSKDEQFLQKVISIIEEHMADVDFHIDTVAETMNMARATFFKKFKSLTQQAPVEFIRDMRLKRAKQYLDSGVGNITEIAYSVGFSSAKYFSTCFRLLYGASPSDYLKSKNSS